MKKDKILYEGKFRDIADREYDHIHLDDGTVIRNNEIIELPGGVNISKYSEKKQIKEITKGMKKVVNSMEKLFNKLVPVDKR